MDFLKKERCSSTETPLPIYLDKTLTMPKYVLKLI
jgi:hypothetical protein